ncbi:hypothetical protein V062_02530 [Staphylococcus aureus R0357]|uniref:hypothetical protein n=1 Tax=Staphylococcus aureus TaxID=1280 RepID=UPI000449CAF1|nr:hypothetical protein [Staphylococcus aureus]EZY61439.1 hypothetical protein V060_02282 [Staphylococcus aureus R0294]EZY62938.1 hypothetical protein V061_01668 [Staphylococcus aureus R0353]EZY64223.1 hypothetical protein V062_02530 [Staphylococcus aureus R0357]EZY72521.1 hypothetical protein V065_02520 [Staphylococcus aureus R0611]EZY77526.1 hypothetical protein V066_02567 [Staphylococcus aureus R0615]
MTEIVRFFEEGEHKYIETHWKAIQGVPIASNHTSGLMVPEDKVKLDKHIDDQGLILTSPSGYKYLLTITDKGELKTKLIS